MHMEARHIDFDRYAAGLASPEEVQTVIKHLEEYPAMLPVVLHKMRRHLMAELRLSPLTDPLACEEDLSE